MSESRTIDILERHQGKLWLPWSDVALSEAQIEAVESVLGFRFPEDYRDVLLLTDGGEIDVPGNRISMIQTHHLPEFNPDPAAGEDLKDVFIFADDGGDYFFFLDPKDTFGHGAWAVYAVEMGCMTAEDALLVAASFHELVERTLAREDVIQGAWDRKLLKKEGPMR